MPGINMVKALQKYLRKISRLRRGVTRHGPAPHKPVLLLAVLQGFEEGWIVGNRIELSPQLVSAFKSVWKRMATKRRGASCEPLINTNGH